MNTFDIDGVIYINRDLVGVYPGPNDIIITGRSFEERDKTIKMLRDRGIYNEVYFNPLPYIEKTRKTSGIHKAKIISKLKSEGYDVKIHFEDDEIQIEEIEKLVPWIKIVHVKHDYTDKENKLPD